MPAVRCSAVRPMRGAALPAAATMLVVPPGQAIAQETRTEIIRQEQADKLRTVTPPAPNRAEKIVQRLETGDGSPESPAAYIRSSTLSIPLAASPPASARGMAGRWLASNECRAAIRREARAPGGLTELMR
jgi:hypothetical protein